MHNPDLLYRKSHCIDQYQTEEKLPSFMLLLSRLALGGGASADEFVGSRLGPFD